MEKSRYLAAVNKPKKKAKRKNKRGKYKRHAKKVLKLGSGGFGKPWSADYLIFRVEFCWENKLLEQNNFSLHWVQVRKFRGEERQFYINYMADNGLPLQPGELPEHRYLLCYLDYYYSNNKEKLKANRAFVYPATKRCDKAIRVPLWIREFQPDEPEYKINRAIAAVFQNTIWHETEV